MLAFTKKFINSSDFYSLKKVYLNVFNIEIYSVINSSLYSIVFRLLYLSIMFFFLFLIDLNNFDSELASITGFNLFNFIYIIKLVIFYFIIYSMIILLLSRFVFENNPNLLDNLLNNLNKISLFVFNKLGFVFNIFNALSLPPKEFEKYLNYAKK